jgi:hypothetical protein
MEASELLLEYLKEQYTQARQHENRQTAASTFLTAASAAILGLAMGQGVLQQENWWAGLAVALLGAANLAINKAHFMGNRFHTTLAGTTRRTLESLCEWNQAKTPSELRQEALEKMNLSGPDISIGKIVSNRLNIIPMVMIAIGVGVALLAWCYGNPA